MRSTNVMQALVEIAAIKTADIPESSRAKARFSLFDWIAVGRAGAREPVSCFVRDLVVEEAGKPAASLFGTTTRVPPRAAALANGTISHALDYDDTHFAHVGHLSVGIYPAALALAEARGACASNLVDAFLLGAETSCRIGVALGREHYEKGFHQTATAGAFGATVAAARILGLDAKRIQMALSLVATRASGLTSQFGTMGKPFNAGISASNGIEAALLAERGFVSCDDGIGGLQGFLDTHTHAVQDYAAFEQPAPARFLFEDIKYKLHACCHGTHAMIEALASIKAQQSPIPDEIASIHLRVNPRWLRVCDLKTPRTGLEIKFSYVWLAAMVMTGIDTTRDDTYNSVLCTDPKLQALAHRVTVEASESVSDMATDLIVTSHAGETLAGSYDLSCRLADSVTEKGLRQKARALIGARAADDLWQAVQSCGSRNIQAAELASFLAG